MPRKEKKLKTRDTIFFFFVEFEIVITQNKFASNPIAPIYFPDKYANA